MRLISFLCSLSWTSRRARTLASVAGVALGTGLVIGVLTVDRNVVLHTQRSVQRRYGDPDLELRRAWTDAKELRQDLERVAGMDGIERVAPVAMELVDFGGRKVRWVRMDLDAVASFRAFARDGGAPIAAAPAGRAWVAERLARKTSLTIGKTIELGGKTFAVAGTLKREGLARMDAVHPVLTGWPTDVVPERTRIWTRGGDRARLEELGFLAQPPPHAIVTATPEDIAMRNGLKICAILSLFLGLFIVFHTMLMTVSERRSEIALLHALGATRRRIGLSFLVDATLQALLGAACGIVLGCALAWAMGRIGVSSIGSVHFPIRELPWAGIGVVSAGGVVLTLLGALYPVFVSSRVPTAQVLYPAGIPMEELRPSPLRWLVPLLFGAALLLVFAFMTWIADARAAPLVAVGLRLAAVAAGAISLMFVMPAVVRGAARLAGRLLPLVGGVRYFLAYRNVSASGHRNTTAVCALMLVFAAIFCMHTLTSALKEEIRSFGAEAIEGRILFHYWPREPRRVDRAPFRAIPGTAGICPVVNEVRSPYLIRGVDFTDLLPREPLLRRLMAGEGVIASRAFAAQYGLEAGGLFRVPTRRGPRDFRVLAVSDAWGYVKPERAFALMAPAELERAFDARTGYANTYIVYHGPGADVAAIRSALYDLDHDPSPVVYTAERLFRNRLWGIDRDFLVFDVILLGAVVLAGIAMFNSLMIRARQRGREVALYRALGMTRAQLVRGLATEGVLLGATGAVLALALGVPCSYLGFLALREVSGLPLVFRLPSAWMAVCAGLCLLVAYLSGRYPARFLAGEDVAAGLQYC